MVNSKKSYTTENGSKTVYDKVLMKSLPAFADLNEEVRQFESKCSWWDLYGVDWAITCTAFGMVFLSLLLMRSEVWWHVAVGICIYGYCHTMFAVKCSHASVHNAVCRSPTWNKIWCLFFSDICASFSADLGYDIHIKTHHPHTNIIGLGDSSTWKVPVLPAYIYMFLAPILVPIITIPVVISEMWGQWAKLLRYAVLGSIGLWINFYLLMNISGFSLKGAILCTWVDRAILTIPYIHVNIFQHIGLPMYSQKNRPKKIYQMSTGVLNLPRNFILDYAFGHSIVSAHVEHHLFPRLSDNMCLKVKPIVSRFLKENGLPYNEDSYMNKVWHFVGKYNELMVDAPPITHFVGIQ